MLLSYAFNLLIARDAGLEPLLSFLQRSTLAQVLSSLDPHVLPVDDVLHRLSVIHPLKSAKPVRDWYHIEGLEVQISVHARWILSEDGIHDLEQLLNSLIQSQVLSSFNQQVVVLLVRTVNSQALGPSDGSQYEESLPHTCYLDVFLSNWFIHKSFILSWHLYIFAWVVEVVVVESVQPLGECAHFFVPLAELA